MTTLFSSILAAALVTQLQGETVQGKVVDDQGKPVAGQAVAVRRPTSWARGSGMKWTEGGAAVVVFR